MGRQDNHTRFLPLLPTVTLTQECSSTLLILLAIPEKHRWQSEAGTLDCQDVSPHRASLTDALLLSQRSELSVGHSLYPMG